MSEGGDQDLETRRGDRHLVAEKERTIRSMTMSEDDIETVPQTRVDSGETLNLVRIWS